MTTPQVDTVAIQAALADQPPSDSANLMQIIQPKVRDRWLGLVRRNYTAEMVQTVLDSTNGSRMFFLHSLYEMMEETWPRLGKNLHDVRSAVSRLSWEVTPYAAKGEKPTGSAQERAKFAEEMVYGMRSNPITGRSGFGETIYDVMDAYGKGLAVLEVLWERGRGGTYKPNATRWVRSVYYDYPQDSNAIERLMLDPTGMGISLQDFPENHFVVGKFAWRSSTLATKAGLLRLLAPWWVYTNFGTEWLMQYAQIFGMPIRWAKYSRAQDLPVISEMLQNIGAASWGAFPVGTELELKESSRSASDNPQAYLLERADTLADLVVLGNTLTSDTKPGGSGSRALGEVHERVEFRRITHAAKWVGENLTDQLIRPILRLNYGNDDECPTLTPVIAEPKDPKAEAERDKTLFVDMGLPVSKEYLYSRHNVPAPKPGDDLFEKPMPTPPPGLGAGQDDEDDEDEEPGTPKPRKPANERPAGKTTALAALDGLEVPGEVIRALERLPEELQAHYVDELVKAGCEKPRYKGGQQGGGRFKTKKVAAAEASVREIMTKWPSEGQHRARRHMMAFGMPDNESEFRSYNSPGLADKVDDKARRVKGLTKVKLAELKTTQSTLDTEKVMAMLSSTADPSSEPLNRSPIVIKRSNKLWLWDGHHRAAMRKLLGDDEMNVRVVDTDED